MNDMVHSMKKPYRCSKEQTMGHFENEEKTEEPRKNIHIARFVALCSVAYTFILTTRMSEDGCHAGQVSCCNKHIMTQSFSE